MMASWTISAALQADSRVNSSSLLMSSSKIFSNAGGLLIAQQFYSEFNGPVYSLFFTGVRFNTPHVVPDYIAG